MDGWSFAEGLAAGIIIGLGGAVLIIWPIFRLAARMGLSVSQAARISAHVAKEYAPLKSRIEELEHQVSLLARFDRG